MTHRCRLCFHPRSVSCTHLHGLFGIIAWFIWPKHGCDLNPSLSRPQDTNLCSVNFKIQLLVIIFIYRWF